MSEIEVAFENGDVPEAPYEDEVRDQVLEQTAEHVAEITAQVERNTWWMRMVVATAFGVAVATMGGCGA